MSNVHVAEDMLSYRVPPEERGYYELSTAIVSSAVNDYRRCRIMVCTREIKALRAFFLSDIFENISGVENPNLFLQKLDEQIDQEIKSGVRRKRAKIDMKCNG